MLIYKYPVNLQPGYVIDRGYYFYDGEAIGYGNVTDSDYEITVAQALGYMASFSLKDSNDDYLTIAQKITQCKSELEAKGCTVTSQDESDAADLAIENILGRARIVRDELLVACDWTQMPDSPLSSEDKTAWGTYRQDLRDIPQDNASVDYYEEITWPTEPA